MSTTTATAPTTAHVTAWDRAVVIALGASGCALSFSALQQMAVAIHVRGLLTFLFPIIVDGFIAYGVRALLVLRTAPLRARIYVWTLFGAATGTSLWANALHAVRLNEQNATAGFRLGDTVVAVLSTIAPLALAAPSTSTSSSPEDRSAPLTGTVTLTDRPRLTGVRSPLTPVRSPPRSSD